MESKVDLNSDVGESFGAYVLGNDEKVMEYVTSANIACAYHAGDHNTMAQTVAIAKRNDTAIGAHPGFPDLGGFGRRNMVIDPDEIFRLVILQIGALKGFCDIESVSMQHVKPHGALYNQAVQDSTIAEAIAKAVRAIDSRLILFGLAGSELLKAGEKQGLQTASEVFADRMYQADGTLTPRSHPEAIIHHPEEAAERIIHTIEKQEISAIDGTVFPAKVDTICVHGDNPEAFQFLQKLYQVLKNKQILMVPVGEC